MKKLNEIIENIDGKESDKIEVFEENKTSKVYVKPTSTFTLLIYFKNGYTQGMKFHSHKQEIRKFGGKETKDQRYALNRLVNLIEDRFKDTYKTAIIYYNPDNKSIIQYSYGSLQHKDKFTWNYEPNGDVIYTAITIPVNLQKAKMQQDEQANYKF